MKIKNNLLSPAIFITLLFVVYSFKENSTTRDEETNIKPKEISQTSTASKKDSLYNWNKEYKSPKYGYTIKVPETYSKTQANRTHIDLKFVDAFGSSILVNVSPRQPSEYKITAHDYTKKWLEQQFKLGTPNAKITYSQKIIVGGEKAFLIENENAFPNQKSMECYLYHKYLAFVITATCEINRFPDYKTLFKNCITSLKL